MKIKGIKTFVIIGLMFFIGFSEVYASAIIAKSVADNFVNSPSIKGLNDFNLKLSLRLNENDKTLDFYSGDEKLMVFQYTDDYIEFVDNRAIVTEILEENFGSSIGIIGIIETVIS